MKYKGGRKSKEEGKTKSIIMVAQEVMICLNVSPDLARM